MKVLPLVVLAYEGPQARAYLAAMARAGFKARQLVLMVLGKDAARGRPVGRLLPRGLRVGFAASKQELAHNHWPRQIRKQHPDLVRALEEQLDTVLEGAPDVLADMSARFDWDAHGESVTRVLVDGLRDDALATALARHAPSAVLFTGGGIVPRSLLELEGLRFLHIHPGVLPAVRGADGLLWSMLARGRPGASCFYMAPGIDVGHVVAKRDFPALVFRAPTPRPDDGTLYRALFSYYDPLLRAALLVQDVLAPAVAAGTPLDALPAEEQDMGTGITYHFLNERLRSLALRRVFPD